MIMATRCAARQNFWQQWNKLNVLLNLMLIFVQHFSRSVMRSRRKNLIKISLSSFRALINLNSLTNLNFRSKLIKLCEILRINYRFCSIRQMRNEFCKQINAPMCNFKLGPKANICTRSWLYRRQNCQFDQREN